MTYRMTHAVAAFAAVLLSLGSLAAIVTVPPVQASMIHAPILA